jgi:uncharacterized protein with FMN-binding domain
MRRITLWLLSTVASVVLLFSYRTSTMGTATSVAGGTAEPGSGAATTSGGTTGGGTTGGGTAAGGTTGGGTTDGTTFTGSVAQTRWGPVQVIITVSSGRITNVTVPVYPKGNGRDIQINAYALPVLQRETITAQSARIDSVSGATVTSQGYKQSLQAAIDAAHLK